MANANDHIMNSSRRIAAALEYLCELRDTAQPKQPITLPKKACDKLIRQLNDAYCDMFGAQTDLTNNANKIEELSQHSYRPTMYPEEGDYNAVRVYIEQRKLKDEIFKNYCATHSRRELCDRLTDDFGWVVDDKSLGKNIQRH